MKTIRYIILILSVIVLLPSCEGFMDQQPPLQLDNEKVLTTYKGLQQATNAAYSPLYSANWYGRDFIVIADLKGNNAKSSPKNSGRFQTEYNWGNNPSSTSLLWATAYNVISRANNVLEYVDALDQAGVTQAEKDQLKGENLFLRALAHFDLVRMFAQPYTFNNGATPGVPYIFKTEIASPARNTVKEVYDYIVADLLEAEGLLGDPDRGTDLKAFACKEAAQALLAKVYLYMGSWQNAYDYATDVISSPKYTLYTALQYPLVWSTVDPSEVIFEVFGNATESNWPSWDEVGYMYYPGGYGDVCASNDLMNLFEAGDIRNTLFQRPAEYPGYAWSSKFPGKGTDRRVNNIPVLRLSEMYLIRMEAALNSATPNTALEDYNTLRTNRQLAAAGSVTLQDVYNERRRELCFEGNHLWDLSRTGRSLDRDNEDNKIVGDVDISFPNYRWAMPIPITELEANPNMEQNDGYSGK